MKRVSRRAATTPDYRSPTTAPSRVTRHAIGEESVLLQDGAHGKWLLFRQPVRVIRAGATSEIADALGVIERACARGYWAAGFLSYEAAPGLDAALCTYPPGDFPLLWFGVYRPPVRLEAVPVADDEYHVSAWTPSLDETAFGRLVARVHDYIRAGDTYQVNLTMRMHARFWGCPLTLFRAMAASQQGACGAFVDVGRWAVCSASPELFVARAGDRLVSRPMKGTARRGLTVDDDRRRIRMLSESKKNRAENVMIVDMVRNDLGRIARSGTVRVLGQFEIERYPTVLQMVSTVEARTDARFADAMAALFPCASITGAPKVRTMQIIRELEDSPRGVYTGTIGYVAPGGDFRFNVAIRTVVVDRETGLAEYGVGGGIVADSTRDAEYDECRHKTRVLTFVMPAFELLETLRWAPGEGYVLLDAHIRRLLDSAEYFGFAVDAGRVRVALEAAVGGFGGESRRVRLTVDRDGAVALETGPICVPLTGRGWRLGWGAPRVDSSNVFLYHKTTHRTVYTQALASAPPGVDDVILLNERGEVTETTIANLAVNVRGEWLTPPVRCGLLAGTLRDALLADGTLREQVLYPSDIMEAADIHVMNSVRGRMRAVKPDRP